MFNVPSGSIIAGVLYLVSGGQSVVYNGTTYTTGQFFRGVLGVTTFTFTGSGTQLVYEQVEIFGAAIEMAENGLDTPTFPDLTVLNGFSIEMVQNAADMVFDDTTIINGFAVELIDYPFYSFEIMEEQE